MSNVSKTFCPIPWIFQAARNNGDLRVCCQANISKNRGLIKDANGNPYNARDGKLQEARNAPLIREMRVDMMEGRWPEECTRCEQEEKSGLNSRRLYELNTWPYQFQDLKAKTAQDGSIDVTEIPVVYYDLRFGNKCNLACRMCGPSDSDSWYEDYFSMTNRNFYFDSHGKVEIEKRGSRWVDTKASYNWHESSQFWKELEENSHNIQHIYMAGGEPLLIEKHYDFLEKCIEQKISANIILEYNTNLTLLPQRVVDLWQNFKQVRVGASIDGYGETLEFQRYPAKWDKIYSNLKKLDNLEAPVISWLAYTVTIYNLMHLPEFMRWKVLESGFQRINSTKKRPIITHHMAHKPEHLNIRVLSEEQKKKVSESFANYKDIYHQSFNDLQAKAAMAILDSVEKYMWNKSYHDEFYEESMNFSLKLDSIRGQNSQKFLP